MDDYNKVDYTSFLQLNEKNGMTWVEKEKKGSSDYKNSTIYIGINKKGQKLLCLKKIPIGNIDLEQIHEPSLSGDKLTVWREIMITKKLMNSSDHPKAFPFVHYYTSFIIYDGVDQPFLGVLYDYVPFTLHEILNVSPFTLKDELEFLLQFSFLMMHLDKLGIHHRDIHWKNIMVDIPLKPKRLRLHYKNLDIETCPQAKLFYIIDFGYSEVIPGKSNFHEWKEFIRRLFHGKHNILVCQNYTDVFKFLLEKNIWTFVQKRKS